MRQRFWTSSEGSIAVNFALMLVPLVILAGVAVDYTAMVSSKRHLQDDLDAALLAAVRIDNKGQSQQVAQEFLGDNDIQISEYSLSEADGTRLLSANARRSYDPAFMHMFSKQDFGVTVSSEVEALVNASEVRIRGLFAHGYHQKLIRLMVERPNGTEEELANFEWEPTGIGGDGVMDGNLNASTFGWVDLGKYTRAWMDLKVFDTGGYTSNPQTIALYGPDQTFEFDDPNFANRVYIHGVPFPNGTELTLLDLASCGETQRIEWEDLGEPGSGNSAVRDFTFDLDVECAGVDLNSIRIRR